jgi:hypothetical protein
MGLIVGIILMALALGIELSVRQARSAESPVSTTAVAARLVLHPHTTRFRGVLSNGAAVTGTLFPTIPGENTIRLVLSGPSEAPKGGSAVTLVAAMLGMRMAPARADLVSGAHGYAGIIDLSMFGRYRVSVRVVTPRGARHGTIRIELPLPR